MKSMKVLKSLLVVGLLCSMNGMIAKAEEDNEKQVETLSTSKEMMKVATGNDVENVEEGIDTSWYNKDLTEFELTTSSQLAGLAKLVNNGNSFSGKTIKLGADIDLNNQEWIPIGTSDKSFSGSFDGQGHTISNLKITRDLDNKANNCYLGLFGHATSEIKNFNVENVDITGSLHVGVIGCSNGKINNVHVRGNINIKGYWYVGGILGNGYANVIGCTVEGDGIETSSISITGGYAGGIIGFHGEGNLVTSDCLVRDIAIIGADNGVGGISGILHYGNKIENCKVENVIIWQTGEPDGEDKRIYAGAFAGTYLTNNGQNPPTLSNNEFIGKIYSNNPKENVFEENRYVGSLWYGANPPAEINIINCTLQELYKVSFNTNGGNSIKDSYAYLGSVSKPKDPVRKDYIFEGWFIDENCLIPFDFKTTVTSDMVLYAKWKQLPSEPVEPPYVPSRPSTPSTPDSNATTESGDKVTVEEVKTDKVVSEVLGKENILTSIEVEEADEPVKVSVDVGRKMKDETVYVVQQNADTGAIELVAVSVADEKGKAVFTTDSTEVLTVTTSLPEGFISTAGEENKATYYVNEEGNFQKGWLESESGDWYYFDEENGQMLRERWGASATDWYFMGADGKMLTNAWVAASEGRWYYVGSDGAMVVNVMVDGCWINEEGIYYSPLYQA